MPFDALGRTRATMMNSMSIKEARMCVHALCVCMDVRESVT